MKITKTLLPMTLITLVLLQGCNQGGSQPADAKTAEIKEEKKEEIAIPVEVSPTSRGEITAFYPATTTLESEDEATVVAKVGGVVEKYYVEEGDEVKAGQPLVQLETDRLKLELDRTNANLRKLKNDLERNEAIYKKNLVSSEAFEKLKFDYESQLASYELAKLELEFAQVKAPIDGVISKRHVKVGNMITVNQAVYQITDFDPLHAVIYVPEKELYKLRVNQKAMVQVDANSETYYQGFVKRISPVVDADSGTFKVTVEVNDPEKQLKPGMFGRLQIIYDMHDNALLVDKRAIISEDDNTWVFVVNDNRASKKMVKTGFINNRHIEILEGLSDGDKVVTTGQNSLKDDSLVEVLNP